MKWISVITDRPNYDFEVIICDKYGHVAAAWLRKGSIVDEFKNWDDVPYINVTHWMPLPAPPQSN